MSSKALQLLRKMQWRNGLECASELMLRFSQYCGILNAYTEGAYFKKIWLTAKRGPEGIPA